MAEKYPDITDWKNLNKYADLFKTSESGGKGQLLDGDPSYVTNDEALVKNLNLNYKVVMRWQRGGAASRASGRPRTNKKPLLATSTSRSGSSPRCRWSKVNLPAYTDGCDADAAKVACDYPPYDLNKIVSTKFADSGQPGRTT